MVLRNWLRQLTSGLIPSEQRRSRTPRTITRQVRAEVLEERTLLSVTLGPDWDAQGPSPAINAQVENVPSTGAGANPVVGAIHDVAPHPTNANIIFIGTTGGGVWRTTNATSLNPTWTPLTDAFPDSAIGAIEFDPTDVTGNTLIAGFGNHSSYFLGTEGGPTQGLLRTTNGGNTWTQLGTAQLTGRNVTGIAARGATILVTANNFKGGTLGGIYRSTDAGATFALLSGVAPGLTAGASFDLVSDPLNNNRLYASVEGVGIFRTDNLGATWTNVSSGDPALNGAITAGGNNNLEMSVSPVDGRLYLVNMRNGQPNYIGFSTNPTVALPTFTSMDLPATNEVGGEGLHTTSPRVKPGGQGSIHLSVVADPITATTFYIGGDRQPSPAGGFTGATSNTLGAQDFTGRLFRGDTTQAAAAPGTAVVGSAQWDHLTHTQNNVFAGGGTASNSAPHADSRDMAFDVNGRLIEVDDGGIYFRTSPRNNTGDWFSLMGNAASGLQIMEMHDVAYDSNSNIIISGNQDTGTTFQTAAGSGVWTSLTTGDGADVAVDNLVGGGQSLRYTGFPAGTGGSLAGRLFRTTYDATGAQVGGFFNVVTTGIVGQFTTPIATNEGAAGRLLIGGANGTFESTDMGATFTSVDAASVNSGRGGAIAYGTPTNANAAYIGTGGVVRGRQAAGAFVATIGLPAVSVDQVNDVVMAPNNSLSLFAVDNNEVFFSSNGGFTSWQNITANLADPQLYSLAYIPHPVNALRDLLVVGGSTGVFSTVMDGIFNWAPFDIGLPSSPAYDLDYDATDDVLVVGTMGRGAWMLANASTSDVLTINGDMDSPNQNDDIVIMNNVGNPALVDVIVNGTSFGPFDTRRFTSIDVNGLGGTDTLTVNGNGTDDGFILSLLGAGHRVLWNNLPINVTSVENYVFNGNGGSDSLSVDIGTANLIGVPITFDGGGGSDILTISGTPATAVDEVIYSPGPDVTEGRLVYENAANSGLMTIDFANLEPVIDMVPAAILTVNGTNSPNAISYSQTPGNATRGRVTVDGFERIDFSNKVTLTLNGMSGSDEFSLNNPSTPIGLASITVNGGDPTASDTVIVTGTAGVDNVTVDQLTMNGARIQGLGPVLTVATTEHLSYSGLGGNDNLTVTSPAGANDFNFAPGAAADSGNIQVSQGADTRVPISFVNLGINGNVLLADAGGGRADTLVFSATNLSDVITVTPISGNVQAFDPAGGSSSFRTVVVQTPGIRNAILAGLSGDDVFNIPGNHPFAAQFGLNAIVVDGGTPDNGSDVLSFNGAGAAITMALGASIITETGFGSVAYSGIETVNLSGAGAGLTTVATANDDLMDYTPQGPASGRVQLNSVAPVVNFSGVGSFTVSTLGAVGDVVVVHGTSSHDVISVNSPTRTVTVTNAIGSALQPVILNNDVETVKIEAGLGNDTVVVVPGLPVGPNTPAPQTLPANLLIEVDGGPPGASDALVIASTVAGGTLLATDFVVHNRSRNAGEGRIRVFRNTGAGGIIPLPDISYSDVEIVSPLVATNADPLIGPQLLQQGPDLFEQNESFQNAAYLGSGETINAQNLAIFPDVNEHPFVPSDTDFFRVIAKDTGTLDFQIYFNTYNGLLPGGGDIDIRVLDSNGTVIAGPGSAAVDAIFGVANAANPTVSPAVAAGNNPDERIRIPVVAGQTYYLQVFNPTNARFNTNGYNLTITNTAAPVPSDLELNDALVNGAIVAPGAIVGANRTFTVPVALLNATPGFYIGKTIHVLTGTNAGLSLPIATQTAGGVLGVPTAGLRGAFAAGDAFSIESTDTGRSQNDNVTRDNTPLIIFRLDDDILQKDLPGNPTGGPTPDQPTRIPWNNTFTAVPGPSTGVAPAADPALFVAGSVPGQIAGYRVAVYEEGTPTTPGGPGPNGLWGYATMIAPGVYQFNFGNTTTNNLFGPATLTNGSHFLTARLEMIDPAAAPGPANAKAPGVRSRSLEVFVDISPPTVAFGNLVSIVDGLHPTSDSSIPGMTGTISDRVTSDTTPTFWGTAEANAIVRAYLDVDGTGTVSGPDILLGQSVAVPTGGTNQAPFGEWQITSTVDLNSPVVLAALGSARDGLRRIIISAEDQAGNIASPTGNATPQQTLSVFIDTQGPQVTRVSIPTAPLFNLFDPKPTTGPTPRVDSLRVTLTDNPARIAAFPYAFANNGLLSNPGHYRLVGDSVGVIPITGVTVTNNATNVFADLIFTSPLPDDRYTLTVSELISDDAGNRLDGESNAIGALASPVFPSGDGVPGGNFVARFNVDSAAEIASVGQGGIFVDANGNWKFDPSDGDLANRDMTFDFGVTTDAIFAGQFTKGVVNNGFDRIGAYGKVNGQFRWLLDIDDNGAFGTADINKIAISQINGLPVAGNFVLGRPGDEVGLFTGTQWFIDLTGDNDVNALGGGDRVLNTNMQGRPFAGDFDGDGLTDLATHSSSLNRFFFDLTSAADGTPGQVDGFFDDTIDWGFAGVLERPAAGDFNLDGVDDIALMVPDRDGAGAALAEWYILRSDATPQVAGKVSRLKHAFSPTPVGNDVFARYGNNIAVPVIGNFDPPLPAVANTAPTFVNLPSPNFGGALTTTFSIQAVDPQGGSTTLSVTAEPAASYWDRELGLSSTGNYQTNWGGKKEKWLEGSSGAWYFLLPSGELYRWNGAKGAQGTLVAKLDAHLYDNPISLVSASQQASAVRATTANGVVTVSRDAAFLGTVMLHVTASDGALSTTTHITIANLGGRQVAARLDADLGFQSATSFQLNWGGRNEKWIKGSAGWYFITPDGSLFSWDRSKNATGSLVARLDQRFYTTPNLLTDADLISTDQTYGFQSNGNLNTNWGGQKEKWFQDKTKAWYYILQDGSVYKWNGQAKKAAGTKVKSFSAAEYANVDRLFDAYDNSMTDWLSVLS